MQRRTFLQTAPAAALRPAGAARPNVVVIMADQHRAGLTARSGCPLDTMPALDRMAARGVAFDRAYCTAPLCVPSRISLLTGRWPHAHRVRENSAGRFAYFEKDLFDVAKSLGYKTALAGKNHSHVAADKLDFARLYMHGGGWKPEPAPKDAAAFDAWLMGLNHGVSGQATPFPVETQLPYRIVSDALEFIRGAGSSPYVIWVSFPEPHNPYQVPKPYFDLFPPDQVPARAVGPEALETRGFKWRWLRGLEEETYPGIDARWRRIKSNYLGMLRLIDDQAGRLLRHLEDAGALQNTVVVYCADHGDYVTDYGLIRKGVGLPEVLTRVPMVWMGAGIPARANAPEFVSIADIMPTLCEAMGTEIPPGVQGRSLWPLLTGKDYPREEFRSVYAEVGFGGLHYGPEDNAPYSIARMGPPGAAKTFDELNPITQSGNMKMVRMGDWKLTFDMMGSGELYNLAADPYELKNLYGDPAAATMRTRMLEELLTWTIRTQSDTPTARYKAKWAPRNWYAPHGKR